MIRKWQSTVLCIVLLSLYLISGCRDADTEKIDFVYHGRAQYLRLSSNCVQKENYLQTGNTFSIESDKAVYGEEIDVNIRVYIGKSYGHINMVIADNTLCITNRYGNEKEKGILLWGPSLSQTVSLGKLSRYAQMDSLVDLRMTFKDGILSYTINEIKAYSQKPVIKPGGMFKFSERAKDFRIYDLSATGKFKSVSEFYNRDFLLNRAQKSVNLAAVSVKNDPNRPAFHFLPPANWNNDPNGLLFYKGYYHMFYQHNPYSDDWDWMHWGHARSIDLIYWEHLPIALWPSIDKGEIHCYSGSGYIMDNGWPILFYTSIGHDEPQQWAALPMDDSLFTWQKHPSNPILTMDIHNGKYISEWRDPYLFRENGETYMVTGGHPSDGTGSIMLYKALNPDLTEWRFLGIPFSGEQKNWECPNLFKLGNKYVLVYSPHGRVEYCTGKLDLENVKYEPEVHGVIDYGAEGNFYAPNTLQKDDGERILFGWLPGFKKAQGWQGAISLPRELSLDENGKLIQYPVTEITQLRKQIVQKSDFVLNKNPLSIGVDKPQFELIVNMGENGAGNVGFQFDDETGELFKVILTPEAFTFGQNTIPVNPVLEERLHSIRFFFDRTVIEIFVNGGEACATKVIYPNQNKLNFAIFCEKETMIDTLILWEIKSIWQTINNPLPQFPLNSQDSLNLFKADEKTYY